jgi:hypothetical protein
MEPGSAEEHIPLAVADHDERREADSAPRHVDVQLPIRRAESGPAFGDGSHSLAVRWLRLKRFPGTAAG